GEGITREITLKNATGNYFAKLAEGSSIDDSGGGLYVVDDRSYYLRIDEAGGAKPTVQDVSGRKVLIVPVQQKLRYSIIF
ncbi:MAG TPA: hypothetical protein VEY06_09050, partial [Flavisolibacter sp.]|nr:hypothetical protein [Flavisolibacter sp.]